VGAGIKVATAARPAINRVFSPRDSLDLGFLPGWERGRRRHRAQNTSRDCARSHRARPGLSWFASLNLSRSLLRLCSATLETIIVTRPPTARTAPTESAATKRGGGQDSPEHQIEFTPAPPTIARPTPAAAVETPTPIFARRTRSSTSSFTCRTWKASASKICERDSGSHSTKAKVPRDHARRTSALFEAV